MGGSDQCRSMLDTETKTRFSLSHRSWSSLPVRIKVRDGGKEVWKEGERDGGREVWKEGERDGGREVWKEGERDGGREERVLERKKEEGRSKTSLTGSLARGTKGEFVVWLVSQMTNTCRLFSTERPNA